MLILLLLILALGFAGHMVFWVGLVNRAHGLGINRKWVDALTLVCIAMFGIMPIAVGAALAEPLLGWRFQVRPAATTAAWAYAAACASYCIIAALQRWQWHRGSARHGPVLSNHSTRINVAAKVAESLAAPGMVSWLCRLPGNQALHLHAQVKELAIPRLPLEHDGLRIAHISDLHMSGRIARAYFERMAEEVNCCEPDLVAITGDLVEWNTCLDWIPHTFGRLRAEGGVYYVLGNHDRRVDQARLRAGLADAGLIHVGGRWLQVTVRNTPLVLVGNEVPWFRPAADLRNCPARDASGRPLRIVLAHSPDQFDWARANDVDLILAGHLHGGQVRLPILGAITSPSLHGVRYASGTFREGNTVMHVSRGTSSLTPIRWNCPPEIAILQLRPGTIEASK
jgi:predicted MPP superfamily phosphohydrolase